jgi:HlyD family secretion protein
MQESNLDYLSGEVQEILGETPPWVTTWGISIIIGVVAMLTLVGIFFTYPDKVKGKLILTTAEPPVPVFSPNTGYISDIRVQEGMTVRKGDLLAVFSSNADVKDVEILEKEVEALSQFDLNSLKTYRPNLSLRLGEIAPSFASFVSVFENLPFAENDQTDRTALYALDEAVRQKETALRSLERMKESANNELKAADKYFESKHKQLAETTDEKFVPDLFEANLKKSSKITEIDGINTEVEKKNAEIFDIKARRLEIQLQQRVGLREKISQLKQSLSYLKAQIQTWKEQYLLSAPADGKVTFFADLTARQYWKKGDELLAIIPHQASKRYVGHVSVPVKGSGKVTKDQPVNIKFDRFPFREFGLVKGKVSKIYPLPKGEEYIVEVSIDSGLTTHLGKELEFQHQMAGQAEIITDERSFVRRLFEKLIAVFDS